MTEFLTLSGLVGWLILGTILCISTCMFSRKNYIGLYILAIICVVTYYKLQLLPQMGWVAWLAVFASYLGVGVGWSLFKWHVHVKKQVAKYKSNISGDVSVQRQNGFYRDLQHDTRPSNNKEQIINNITWWPFGILDFFLSDFIVYIFDSLSNVYGYIANRSLCGVEKPPTTE